MSVDQTSVDSSRPARIASVDAFRGLTILLMVFVNDLGQSAPAWMHHIQPPDADGMTLADIVFPFFLFIAGVSIPLAVNAARRKGTSNLLIVTHVFTRTLGLLLMGLIGVNLGECTGMNSQLWGLLAYVAIILAWCIVPTGSGAKRKVLLGLKIVGILGLIVLLAVYRRDPVETEVAFLGAVTDWTWLRTSWWGILGLIGWAYFVSAILYLLIGSRREWLVAATGLLMLMYVISNNGGFFTRVDDKPWLASIRPAIDGVQWLLASIEKYVGFGSQLGTLPATVMSGCVLGTTLLPNSGIDTVRDRVRWCLVYAFGLFVAGAMMDTFGGINKISATPTWCLWCASLATLSWLGLYLLMDVWKFSAWSIAIRPAGGNPLIAYLLHPIILFALGLVGVGGAVRGYSESPSSAMVVLGSLGMAVVVCALTGLIARAGLRIRV